MKFACFKKDSDSYRKIPEAKSRFIYLKECSLMYALSSIPDIFYSHSIDKRKIFFKIEKKTVFFHDFFLSKWKKVRPVQQKAVV